MTLRVLLVATLAALMISGPSDSASALRKKGFNCSPVLGYCKGIVRENGRIKLVLILESPSHGSRYKLCVKPPRESRECKFFRLVNDQIGLPHSRIDLARNFSSQHKGRYAVSWHQGIRLGPVLHFSKD